MPYVDLPVGESMYLTPNKKHGYFSAYAPRFDVSVTAKNKNVYALQIASLNSKHVGCEAIPGDSLWYKYGTDDDVMILCE
jgi:hypothetical protein